LVEVQSAAASQLPTERSETDPLRVTALLRDRPAARGRDVRHLLGGVGLESSASPQCASLAAMVGASVSPRAA